MNNDTICAPATATGGALAIIRISGPAAFSAAGCLCSLRFDHMEANTVRYAHIVAPDGETIDEAMVSIFRAPHSYTGEDSVEICCHGSRYVLNRILELLVASGCRMAGPGEFTQRAFLNGKMDLSQAEAVADLIASTSRATHQMALSQLRGHFSDELSSLREQLLTLTSLLELELDFSDHEDLQFADRGELLELAKKIDGHIQKLAHSFETGRALKQGIPVAIIGKTNVGKSTLLNRLIGDEKAIVSDIHGTTRDVIEDTTTIRGITFRFIDTAGIRHTNDQIERLGIERTYQKLREATIVLWIIDERPTEKDISDIQEKTRGKSLIIIRNKTDKDTIPGCGGVTDDVSPLSALCAPLLGISAKYNQGISELEEAIYQAANIPEVTENDVIITSARHYESLMQAHATFTRVIVSLEQGISGDLIAEDLRLVLSQLGEITGRGTITPHEVLGNIFKNFCVGK